MTNHNAQFTDKHAKAVRSDALKIKRARKKMLVAYKTMMKTRIIIDGGNIRARIFPKVTIAIDILESHQTYLETRLARLVERL